MNTRFVRSSCFTAVLGEWLVLLSASIASADNWPQWRGPTGDGVSRETGLPLVWSERAGVAWKCPLPAWGNSTPAIWEDAIFLTSHVDEQQLRLLRIDGKTGRVVWTRRGGYGFDAATRRSPQIKQQSRPAQVPRYAQSGHPVSGDGRP